MQFSKWANNEKKLFVLRVLMENEGVRDYQSTERNQSVFAIKWPFSATLKLIFAVIAYCDWVDGHILLILHFTS
jgi:hypothetical protein